MLQGCSKKRPDIYFELNKHCIIVEVDENQHKGYDDSCECARINEIVNGIGGRSLIFIRFNPDVVKYKGKKMHISLQDRLDLLVYTIKLYLVQEPSWFSILMVQLYYDCHHNYFKCCQIENITKQVCI